MFAHTISRSPYFAEACSTLSLWNIRKTKYPKKGERYGVSSSVCKPCDKSCPYSVRMFVFRPYFLTNTRGSVFQRRMRGGFSVLVKSVKRVKKGS